MTQQNNLRLFRELNNEQSTRVVKYSSAHLDKPLFLVRYKDSSSKNTDKLLVYKDGRIFATVSLANLKKTFLSVSEDLVVPDNLSPWLDSFKEVGLVEYYMHDLVSIINNLDNDKLDLMTLEGFASFVNLYGDYVAQDERNAHLRVYADHELITGTWDYFYNYLYWPGFDEKQKYAAWSRHHPEIDTKELCLRLKEMVSAFDKNIRLFEH